VPALVAYFLATIRGVGQGPFRIDADAMEAVKRYAWPGNVRELRNAVERMMLLAEGGRITTACLPPEVARTTSRDHLPADELNIEKVERHLILRALRETGGRKTEAAERLGISLRTLYNKLQLYKSEEAPSAPQ